MCRARVWNTESGESRAEAKRRRRLKRKKERNEYECRLGPRRQTGGILDGSWAGGRATTGNREDGRAMAWGRSGCRGLRGAGRGEARRGPMKRGAARVTQTACDVRSK